MGAVERDKYTAETFAAELRERIKTGRYPVGSKLPAIRNFVDEEGVGRGVAEKALDRLRAEGLVEARRGSGTYVRDGRLLRVSPARVSRQQWGKGRSIQAHDAATPPEPIDIRVGDVEPRPDIAAALGAASGEAVLSRYRRYVKGKRVVQVATSYLPIELTRGTRIEHTDTGPGGVYARLAEQGYGPSDFDERVIGRAPTPDEIEDLGLRREGGMVFEIMRFAYAGDRCVAVERMVLDAEAYELAYRFSA